MLKRSLLLILLIAAAAIGGHAQDAWKGHQPTLTPQQSGTTQLLIAVSPVNSRVVWAAGAGGTYVVTTDGGSTWKSGVVPGAESLQFRDVQGVSDQVAYLMSIGDNTGDFRIYKTEDGGAHWTIQFTNKTVNAFYDCFAFWTPDRGIAHSDSVNGVFPDIRTTNGTTWQSIAGNMPACFGRRSFVLLERNLHHYARTAKRLDYHRRLKHRTDTGDSRWRRHLECVRHSAREQRQCGRLLGGVSRSLAWHCGWRRPDHEQCCPGRNLGRWRPNMDAYQQASHSRSDLLSRLCAWPRTAR